MRNQKRKFYHGELFEIDINKIPKKDKRTFVGVKKTEINFGDFTKPCKIEGLKVGYGVRLYFRCIHCNSRVSKLYTSPKPSPTSEIGCRHCIGINYISQQATKTQFDYEFHLLEKIGRKIDPNFKVRSLDTPCPERRKYMNKLKYFELRVKYTSVQLKAREKFFAISKAVIRD